jgi:hypothetical protein
MRRRRWWWERKEHRTETDPASHVVTYNLSHHHLRHCCSNAWLLGLRVAQGTRCVMQELYSLHYAAQTMQELDSMHCATRCRHSLHRSWCGFYILLMRSLLHCTSSPSTLWNRFALHCALASLSYLNFLSWFPSSLHFIVPNCLLTLRSVVLFPENRTMKGASFSKDRAETDMLMYRFSSRI